MRVLIVARRRDGAFAPFVVEQANALKDSGCFVDFYGVDSGGFLGYVTSLNGIKKRIYSFSPDIIHAHFGLSGLLSCLQTKVPVVTTYHGSDINDPRLFPLSKLSIILSSWNIFVSSQNISIAKPKNHYSLIPCGIDLSNFPTIEKSEAREVMHLSQNKRYVLFCSSFDREVKKPELAKKVISFLNVTDIELLEFKSFTRKEANILLCAVDALLMTSQNEGSPQVIKEALACGTPIVSVDVGDVRERTSGVDGCFISNSWEATELVELLKKALAFKDRTRGREKIVSDGIDNPSIAKKLLTIYNQLLTLHR